MTRTNDIRWCKVDERKPGLTDYLKRYPTTKDSGVDWLGEVPAHWEIFRLKSSVTNVLEYATETRRENGPVVALENVESWTGRVTQADLGSSFDSQLKRFQAGDVLFGKLRPYLAKVARCPISGLCVGEFLVLRPRCGAYVGAYLEHLLRSKPLIDAVNSSTFGAKMPRAGWQFMGGCQSLGRLSQSKRRSSVSLNTQTGAFGVTSAPSRS